MLRLKCGVERLGQGGEPLLVERHVVPRLGDVVAPPLVHVLVVEHAPPDRTTGEGDHRPHLLFEAGRRGANDDPCRGERVRPVELALEVGDCRLFVHDHQVLLLLGGGDGGVLGLVEGDARGTRVLAEGVVADAVLDQVTGNGGGRGLVPRGRSSRELHTRRIWSGGDEPSAGDGRQSGPDSVIKVVSRLGRGEVV
jgi:hypothetical protein